ncbi:MAG: type II toxin-antitoxin system HicB family antitoxin [Desulfuromonadales bacterium]|nr:type II toxin-antitoxin system HicB family antitoxin [Desulfuromonadales bacterium]
MKDMIKHKGYFGSVHYNSDDRIFYGKIEFIRSLVSYEGQDADSLESAFHEAVDDYLATCAELGCEPEKPFKGSFNVRIAPELHERVMIAASQHGMTLNRFVAETLSQAVSH